MEYSINIRDILTLIKKNVKKVVVFGVIFAMLFTLLLIGYSHIKGKQSKDIDIKENEQRYADWTNSSKIVQDKYTNNIISAYDMLENHPLLSINPNNCVARNISVTFDQDREISRVYTVKGWIESLKCSELFGTNSEKVKQFRYDLISVEGDNGEVLIRIFDTNEYDVNSVAKKIVAVIKKNATSKGLKIVDIQNNTIKGFSQVLFDKQDTIRYDISRVINEFNTLESFELESSKNSNSKAEINYSSIIMYAFIGVIVGLSLAILTLLIITSINGTIISCNQIEEVFAFENLGIINSINESDIRLTNALVRAVTENVANVMLISEKYNNNYEKIATALDKNDEIIFKYGTIELDTEEQIDMLKDTDKLILPVIIGKSTSKEISNILKCAHKFKKEVLGYIVVE